MAEFDIVVRGGTVATAADTTICDIGVKDGRIAALGREPLPALTRREWYDIVEAYRGGPMP